MAAIVVAGGGTAENRERVVEGRSFFSTFINLFGKPDEHIIQKYCLPSHVIFNLLQEIKDDLEPSTRSQAIPALSIGLQPFIFCPPVLFNILWLLYFFIL